MAYGRLDIYWPDGEYDSYLLETPSVSVGRSSGCTIVLDTETISRYHFSIHREGDQTYISDMDSANGTFVDGHRLNADDKLEMFGGEELQAGHLRMIYYAEDDQPTMPLYDFAEDTQRFEREDFGFKVDVTEPETGVPPGAHKTIDITITNASEEPQVYTVDVAGLPDGWGRVNRPTLRLDPEEFGHVALSVKPPRGSDTAPGEYPITITVAHEDDPDKKIDAYTTVHIEAFNAFAMRLLTARVTPHNGFRLQVHNMGSQALPVHFSAVSDDDALNVGFQRPQLSLAPGEETVIKGAVTPRRRRLLGTPESREFDLLVRSLDEAGFLAAVRGQYTDEPIMPRWAAAATGVLTLIAIGLIVVGVAMLVQVSPPEPTLTGLRGDTNRVVSGTPVALSWEAAEVERFNLRVNGQIVTPDIPGTARTATLQTGSYADETITVELVGIRDDATVSQTLNVEVLRRLSLVTFEVAPQPIVRNVIHSVAINWQVNGATQTRLEGVESLRRAENEPVQVEPSRGATASVRVQGYVPDNFLRITLVAEGPLDSQQSWTREVEVIDPVCTPNVAGFTLREYPTEDANVVRTLTSDQPEPIVVESMDQSRQWLSTRIEGGGRVWGKRSELSCADTFSVDNLRITVVTPPPTPTMPPTTPTARPTQPETVTPTDAVTATANPGTPTEGNDDQS